MPKTRKSLINKGQMKSRKSNDKVENSLKQSFQKGDF